jgi:hypothetical protein
MRTWAVLAVAIGCGGSSDRPPHEPATPSPLLPGTPGERDPEPLADDEPLSADEPPPDFPEGTRSLELRKTISVRLEPGEAAKRIGTIAVDTRVAWVRTRPAKGCKQPWVEILPRGWICGDYVKPSKRMPHGREVPYLERGEIVPGVYGKVTTPNSVVWVPPPKPRGKDKDKARDKNGKATARGGKVDREKPAPVSREVAAPEGPKLIEGPPLVGSVTVRRYGELTVGGKQYWKIKQREQEYVLRQAITQHRPSSYVGTRLGDETGWELPIAFVWPRVAGWQQAFTTYRPLAGGIHRKLPAKTPVQILEVSHDKAGKPNAYRIGESEWIAAVDLRRFEPAPPPPYLEPGERWVDVDLDSQILVAYEGEVPVYATLISSGAASTPTRTGVYRMWLKESEADMRGLGEDPYSVATVPWTQFFSAQHELAVHTAYWHDQFGTRRSHGCVNLAPRDARWLYFWSEPQVPPGWTMAAGIPEAPGSIIRVRSKEDPQPETKEYAKKVEDARRINAPIR